MYRHRAPFWSATLFIAILLACALGSAFALDRPRAAVVAEPRARGLLG